MPYIYKDTANNNYIKFEEDAFDNYDATTFNISNHTTTTLTREDLNDYIFDDDIDNHTTYEIVCYTDATNHINDEGPNLSELTT